MNLPKELNEGELSRIVGGFTYTDDAEAKTITITIEESDISSINIMNYQETLETVRTKVNEQLKVNITDADWAKIESTVLGNIMAIYQRTITKIIVTYTSAAAGENQISDISVA